MRRQSLFNRFSPRSLPVLTSATALLICVISGCQSPEKTAGELEYNDDIQQVGYFRNTTTQRAWPCIDTPTPDAVASSLEPRNLRRRADEEPREIGLFETLHLALSQNKIIETSALGGVGAKAVLTNPTGVASVYDPAIQSSGVLFGRRSVESALADFDTTFSTSLTFRRADLQGASSIGGGNSAAFTSSLGKQFATGGSISLNHDWNYTVDPVPVGSSSPNYFGRVGVSVRQPLLAGSGVDYTRIAGPANPSFGAITGVSQGVTIARINEDVSLATFEIAIRNGLRDVENAYWTLYFAYKSYDTAVEAHKSAVRTWSETNTRREVGLTAEADELQARDRLYETKASVQTSLNSLYAAESELRRLVGLPMNDGKVLRPSDEPVTAEFVPNWRACIKEALTNRIELRRQKWSVKSLQLQLQAARSLVRPRLDFVAGYDIHGLGDSLLAYNNGPFQNAYRSFGTGDTNSWNAGLQLSVPVGLRFTRSQALNIELQLNKATAVLASQERNIAHDIAIAIQDVTSAYAAAQSNLKRVEAAKKRLKVLEPAIGETATLDLLVRAQASLAAAENAYFQQIVDYNRALMNLSFARGTLIADRGVTLAEGQWNPEAQQDALKRASARTHAKDASHLQTLPHEFASPGPTGSVELRMEESPDKPPVPELPPVQENDADTGASRPEHTEKYQDVPEQLSRFRVPNRLRQPGPQDLTEHAQQVVLPPVSPQRTRSQPSSYPQAPQSASQAVPHDSSEAAGYPPLDAYRN